MSGNNNIYLILFSIISAKMIKLIGKVPTIPFINCLVRASKKDLITLCARIIYD